MGAVRRIMADVCVCGGGSAGVGAAYAAASRGLRVAVVERDLQLGGTSTVGGVNCWEPGISGFTAHGLLARALLARPGSAGVGVTTHHCTRETNYGLSSLAADRPYEDTLKRLDLPGDNVARFHFEPEAMSGAMRDLLLGTGNVRLLMGVQFAQAVREGSRIIGVLCCDGNGELLVEAPLVVDATADALVVRAMGGAVMRGEECAADFDEPSAPEQRSDIINGVSLIFRVTPQGVPADGVGAEAPAWARTPDAVSWLSRNEPAIATNTYPDGDLNCNVLPIMQGREFAAYAPEEGYHACLCRVLLYWDHLKRNRPMWKAYRMKSVFPRVGVRESVRAVTDIILREQDCRAGYLAQRHAERIVCLADHVLDTHGEKNTRAKDWEPLRAPFGVYYDCLLPKGIDGLLVAGRHAGFTHIAASSCRLNRSMMEMGEAAGAACALAHKRGCAPRQVSVCALREELRMDEYVRFVQTAYERIGR